MIRHCRCGQPILARSPDCNRRGHTARLFQVTLTHRTAKAAVEMEIGQRDHRHPFPFPRISSLSMTCKIQMMTVFHMPTNLTVIKPPSWSYSILFACVVGVSHIHMIKICNLLNVTKDFVYMINGMDVSCSVLRHVLFVHWLYWGFRILN